MPAPLYVSTRGGGDAVPFREALLDGLAPDGGLYVPTEIPALPDDWATASDRADLGARVLAAWLPEVANLGALVEDALGHFRFLLFYFGCAAAGAASSRQAWDAQHW